MKPDTYIKNYNKLLKYAESSGVSVVYIERNESASWKKDLRVIQLSPDTSGKVEELPLLLHELGHMRDDFTLGVNKDLEKAYVQFNKLMSGYIKNISKKNKILVIDTEYRAWVYGIAIAKQLSIRLGKWYYKEMEVNLMAYFEYAYPKSFAAKYENYIKSKK